MKLEKVKEEIGQLETRKLGSIKTIRDLIRLVRQNRISPDATINVRGSIAGPVNIYAEEDSIIID